MRVLTSNTGLESGLSLDEIESRLLEADRYLLHKKRGCSSLGDYARELTGVNSPDGRSVALVRGGSLIVKSLNGGEEPITSMGFETNSTALTNWYGDDLVTTIRSSGAGANSDLFLYSLMECEAKPLVQTQYNESAGRISPNGRWLAYVSDESGESNVFVQPFPGPGVSRRISRSGGMQPVWREDGEELFYLEPGGRLMAVPTGGSSFDPGEPVELFRFSTTALEGEVPVAVTDNGQRFLVLERIGDLPPLKLVQNWTAMLPAEP